jgi:hypothetical protein
MNMKEECRNDKKIKWRMKNTRTKGGTGEGREGKQDEKVTSAHERCEALTAVTTRRHIPEDVQSTL